MDGDKTTPIARVGRMESIYYWAQWADPRKPKERFIARWCTLWHVLDLHRDPRNSREFWLVCGDEREHPPATIVGDSEGIKDKYCARKGAADRD